MAELTHVVILGAGFVGIGALKKLRDANVRITIVDKRDYHTFQPLLYRGGHRRAGRHGSGVSDPRAPAQCCNVCENRMVE